MHIFISSGPYFYEEEYPEIYVARNENTNEIKKFTIMDWSENKKLFEDAHFSKFLYFQIILKNRGLCFDKKFLDNMAVGALNSLYKFLLGKNKALTQKDDNYYCKNFELFERLSDNIDVKILQKIKYVPKLDHWKELEMLEA